MSIFGSRNKTTVGTQVMRVIQDNMLPDSIKTGAVNALLDKSSQSVEYIMEEMVGGLGLKVDAMYRYGRDRYVNGLPRGVATSAITGSKVVEEAIEADVGPIDDISYYHLRPVNLLHVGWTKLVSQYGYDSIENSMQVDGKTVYLSDMVAVVTETNFKELENGSMDRWGVLPNVGQTPKKRLLSTGFMELEKQPEFIVDASAPNDYLKVSYCWEVEEDKVTEGVTIKVKVIKEGTLQIPVTGFDLSANYFQVRFMQNGKAGYWMYRFGSGEKPAVDKVFEAAPNTIGTFYPWAYFRFDKRSMNDNKGTPEFNGNKQLLDKISMDLEDITKNIHDNPDIKDVEQAMMMLAVPANTKNEDERRYLYDFFDKMYIAATANNTTLKTLAAAQMDAKMGRTPMAGNSIIIQDKKFKMAVSFTGIFKRRVAGKIGRVGTHDSGITNNFDARSYIDPTGTTSMWMPVYGLHYYRRQISENLYEEITVQQLKTVFWIWGDYTDTADGEEPILLIPLDYEIVSEYSVIDRERLYGRSMHYVFNSRVVTRLKWYQTGIFKVFMIVVSIIIMIYNIQAGMAALKAALAAGATLSALAYMVLVALVKYIIVAVLVRVFIKIVGVKIAFIAAIVAAVFGMYQYIDAGSLAGAPWAQELLSISTNLTKGISREIGNEMDALRSEAERFEKEMDTKIKLLEDTQKLLDDNILLTPMMLWGESPDDFYQRTVHSGNIGVVGIDAVSSYVEMQLRLPKLSDSVGDFV